MYLYGVTRMSIHQAISVGNLLLDAGNYRIVKQSSQKDALDAIINEQGKKLVKLAKDIVTNGLSPFDLPMVVSAAPPNGNYIVIEGNRRLTAIKLMLEPDLAQGTSIYASFRKLNKNNADAIPKVIICAIAPSKETGLVWINRKHASGLDGAGTEPWSAMAKERADAEQGKPTPALDVVNYVMTNPELDTGVKKILRGSEFPVSSLVRLIADSTVQDTVGFSLKNGKVVSDSDKNRVMEIMTEVVSVIATKKFMGKPFTVRDIDSDSQREDFINEIASKHSKKGKKQGEWVVTGTPKDLSSGKSVPVTKTKKGTPTTEERPNLVPREFKLKLPAGKVTDVFEEMKTLDVTRYRHSAAVLFRVFMEFTADGFIVKKGVKFKKDKPNLLEKLQTVMAFVLDGNIMTEKELTPVRVEINQKDSFLSPNTLNAFVHSPWMNPDPLKLKLAWNDAQLLIERLWAA